MPKNPYLDLPDHAFWRRAVARTPLAELDPVVEAAFEIAPTDRVATAGSCFAQHIARHLRTKGFNYFVAEPAHPLLPAALADEFNYGTYSARFGNLYTARQLAQLLERAYGRFTPQDNVWREGDRFIDPFRPLIQPRGFASLAELHRDRAQHFAAVRRMVEEMDVFVFTFGLTECWVDQRDGAVFPLCPGTAGGVFDPAIHVFLNQTFEQVVEDFSAVLRTIRTINPAVRVLMTVSPVPLVATATDKHVLVATTYSKAVLRVAAERLTQMFQGVAYFPSYEIITGGGATGARYFAEDDRRSVLERGVEHVMRLVFKHYAPSAVAEPQRPTEVEPAQTPQAQALVEAICDEAALDRLDAGERRRIAAGSSPG